MTSRPNVLLCCSGSVATIKVPEIVVNLHKWANVMVVCSPHAIHFLQSARDYNLDIYEEYERIRQLKEILITDSHEWIAWNRKGDPVLHIELRRWADILLIAPASANTIAKAANGICDNLLLCVIRAWDYTRPAICCPAMNTYMLDHSSIRSHFALLQSFGFKILDSDIKNLACGDVGKGAMVSVSRIVESCQQALEIQSEHRITEKEHAENAISIILRRGVSNDTDVTQTDIRRAEPTTVVMVFFLGFLIGILYNSRRNTK